MQNLHINSIDLRFDFERYFLLPGLSIPMNIGKGNLQEIFFHWADWEETCKVQLHLLVNSPQGMKKLELIHKKVEELNEIPVWVDRQGRKIKTNLKELYATYSHPVLRNILFENSSDNFSVSFGGPQGPYSDALSLRWLKQDLFLSFVYLNLLEKKLPFRDFRLRYEKEIPTTIDGKYSFRNIQIQQLSTEGILFKVPREVLNEWCGVNRFQKIVPAVDFSPLKKDFLLFSETSFKIDIGKFLENFLQFHSQNLSAKPYFPMFLTWKQFRPNKSDENFLESVLRPFLKLVKMEMGKQLDQFKEPLF